MPTTGMPIFTDTVRQEFFIEALGGSKNPVTYLDRFPSTVYTKTIDSLLVHFLYALLGPVGVGQLKEEFLEARLQIEAAGLSTVDLDAAYANPFNFARLAFETYNLDADASLLPSDQRAQILAQDASFRNRAQDFLKGARAGGTKLGIKLAARSGLVRPVEVVENYRALYDRYSDSPLFLPYVGTTTSTNEAIVQPRAMVPQSSVQSFSAVGNPTQGYFSLILPVGPAFQTILVGTNSASNLITVPDPTQFPAGTFITMTHQTSVTTPPFPSTTPSLWARSGGPVSTTQVAMVDVNGNPVNAPSTGSFYVYVGYAETYPLPFNAAAADIQNALSALPVIGAGNVVVTGGPMPNQDVIVSFVQGLADQPIATLQANLGPDIPTGLGTTFPQLADVVSNTLGMTVPVVNDMSGINADGQTAGIAPADEYAMRLAVDRIRPQTCLITAGEGASPTQRQPATVFSASNYTEVIRYATGRTSTPWPPLDNIHWIEAGQEHEAPLPTGVTHQNYVGFHNIADIISYTDGAQMDQYYNDPTQDPAYGTAGFQPIWVRYFDVHIGPFSQAQILLYPFLGSLTDPNAQYQANRAAAAQTEPLVITTTVDGTGVINDIYPVDYYSSQGVTQPSSNPLWASAERTEGADYLEIDLGQTQPVNYLYFEATRKPCDISLDYELLDLAPRRAFSPVTVAPSTVGNSTLNMSFDAAASNPWEPIEIFFGNYRGAQLFTRFLRLGFFRTPANSPFVINGVPSIPYSFEIRNLRVGRNVV